MRSLSIRLPFIPLYVQNMAKNIILGAAGLKEEAAYYPVMCCYVITYRCGMRCTYCVDNSLSRSKDGTYQELDTAGVFRTLAGIRECCDIIGLSGGEPTAREDLPHILGECRRLGFREIVLNISGIELDGSIEYLGDAHQVMIGMDTLDPMVFERITGGTAQQFARQQENVQLLLRSRRRLRYDLCVCVVIIPGMIDEARRMVSWCFANDITVSISPFLDGTRVHEDLRRSSKYEDFIGELVAHRRRGMPLFGTPRYFEGLRTLAPFDCYPHANIEVNPMGELKWPCARLEQPGAPSFADGATFREMVDAARERIGPLPDCDNLCHHACHLPLSTLIQRPWLVLEETFQILRRRRWAG